MPCIFPFTYSDGKYPDLSARPLVSHYQCTKRDTKLANGWGSAFWCATKVNADGYYEKFDWCNDDCPNPETNINYAYESSKIYWTYEKESKTIRNQKCKYVHTYSHEFLLKTKKAIKNWKTQVFNIQAAPFCSFIRYLGVAT